MSGAFRSNKPRGNSKGYSDLGASKGQYLDRSKKLLTNIKLKGINKSIYKKDDGGEKVMACGMKHPKAKKATKKTSKKKK